MSIEKILENEEKCLIIIIRNITLKNTDLEKSFDEEYQGVLKIKFETINLVQTGNLNKILFKELIWMKKFEIYKLRKSFKKFRIIYKNG